MVLDNRVVVANFIVWFVVYGVLLYFVGIPSTGTVVFCILCLLVAPVLDAVLSPPKSDLYWQQ